MRASLLLVGLGNKKKNLMMDQHYLILNLGAAKIDEFFKIKKENQSLAYIYISRI